MLLSELYKQTKAQINESVKIVWEKKGKSLKRLYRCESGKIVDSYKKCSDNYHDFNIPKNKKLVSVLSQTQMKDKK